MESGNALAAKLAVSALTLAGDESQLAQARGFSDPAQLAEMAREMSDVAAGSSKAASRMDLCVA